MLGWNLSSILKDKIEYDDNYYNVWQKSIADWICENGATAKKYIFSVSDSESTGVGANRVVDDSYYKNAVLACLFPIIHLFS